MRMNHVGKKKSHRRFIDFVSTPDTGRISSKTLFSCSRFVCHDLIVGGYCFILELSMTAEGGGGKQWG